ncbi:HIG1 domain family member 1A, mitochondrial-like isoform X1 [Branchiostoma floridae x Branchiostoma japonicum]
MTGSNEKKPPVFEMTTSTDAQDYEHRSKLWEKSMKEPMVPIGLAGTVAAVMYGAVNYRKYRRAGMSTSVFLMQFRVIAQSMVVGCMTLGVGYTLVSDYILKHRQPKASPTYYTDQVQDYRQMESNFWKE